jgi:hypothetical protein
MRFHAMSFLLGVGLTAALVKARGRLKPVAVEVTALGVHLLRLGRSLVEREREDLEDVWAEVEERLRERARATRRPHPVHTNGAHAPARA